MNDFTFQNKTKVYFGKNQLGNLHKEVLAFGDKVLLAYGGGSIKKIGLYDKVMAELTSNGITVFELPGVEPNPHHTTVNKGVEICRKNSIPVLLAVGGGSTIDCCKGIAATVNSPVDNVWDLVEKKAAFTETLPVIAMPTIASTGSEMDTSCQIANTELGVKAGLASPLLRPVASFLNPENTFSVSPKQTACGGYDIMMHLMDMNYFVDSPKNPLQFHVVEALLKTLREQLPIALKEPDNYEARGTLLWAASWALNSFCTSGFKTLPSNHGLEQLSAFYNMTHGMALAIISPKWMKYLLEKDPTTAKDFASFGVNVMGCAPAENDKEGANLAVEALQSFICDELHLPRTFSECGVDDSKFEEMAKKACRGQESLKPTYRELTVEDCVNIYRMCL